MNAQAMISIANGVPQSNIMMALGAVKTTGAAECSPHRGWRFPGVPTNILGLHAAPLPLYKHIINPTFLDNTPEEKTQFKK